MKTLYYYLLCLSTLSAKDKNFEEARFKEVAMGKCPHKPGELKPFFNPDEFEMD